MQEVDKSNTSMDLPTKANVVMQEVEANNVLMGDMEGIVGKLKEFFKVLREPKTMLDLSNFIIRLWIRLSVNSCLAFPCV